MANTANIEIVNAALNLPFTNSLDNDVAIYPSSSNQSIHIGCSTGGNSAIKITSNKVEMSYPCYAQSLVASNYVTYSRLFSAPSDFTASVVSIPSTQTSYQDVVSITYTPIDTGGRTSRVICECVYQWYQTDGASGADSYNIALRDSANNELDMCRPNYIYDSSLVNGGGGRELIKPLCGILTTTGTSNLLFKLSCKALSTNDTQYVDLTYTKFLIQQFVI